MKINELYIAYEPLIKRLLNESNGITYSAHFLEPDMKRITENPSVQALNEIRKVYLLGIIERAHLACITSLARNIRWLEATENAFRTKNALAFSAALRGFLESAADAHDVMAYLPLALDKICPYLYLVIINSEDVDNFMVNLEKLEQKLIHYAYAKRQKGSDFLEQHKNKTNAEYIKQIENFGASDAKNLYSELCELTHPASASVWCFLDEQKQSLSFNPNKDSNVIDDLMIRYEGTIESLAQFSINPALIGLCYLKRLIPDWPAPHDTEMAEIGNIKSKLNTIDKFIREYVVGSVDKLTLIQSLK